MLLGFRIAVMKLWSNPLSFGPTIGKCPQTKCFTQGIENSNARALVVKGINVLLTLLQVKMLHSIVKYSNILSANVLRCLSS
jgi:hypothetical protein